MNPFFVEIQFCEITRGESSVISAAEFKQSQELQTMESQVKQRIQSALKDAHVQREQSRQQAEQYIVDAQNEAQQMVVQWEQEAKAQAVTEAVAWVQDELEFRQALLEELSIGVATQIRSVVTHWAKGIDKADLIVSELTEQVIEKLGEGVITLIVAEADYDLLNNKLSNQFKIKVDKGLDSGIAELQSSGLSARIDLNQNLELLLKAFVFQSNIGDQSEELDSGVENVDEESLKSEDLDMSATTDLDNEDELDIDSSSIAEEFETDDPDYNEAY